MKTRTKIVLIAVLLLAITACLCGDGGDRETKCSLKCQHIEDEDDWNTCMLECIAGHTPIPDTPEPTRIPELRDG